MLIEILFQFWVEGGELCLACAHQFEDEVWGFNGHSYYCWFHVGNLENYGKITDIRKLETSKEFVETESAVAWVFGEFEAGEFRLGLHYSECLLGVIWVSI
jgi:hypothetical protein